VHAERYRVEYNTVRPHEALSWNRPHDVHVGLADPRVPQLSRARVLPTA
jgi:putative transposase